MVSRQNITLKGIIEGIGTCRRGLLGANKNLFATEAFSSSYCRLICLLFNSDRSCLKIASVQKTIIEATAFDGVVPHKRSS